MRRVRQATQHEVVAAWLRAELDSPRFGHHLRLGDVDRQIIERPDLNDPAENALRRQLLRYREDILTTIPEETEWWEAELTAEDLAGLFAIHYPAWEVSSGRTGKLLNAAEAIRDGSRPTSDDSKIAEGLAAIQENVSGIYQTLKAGKGVGPLVLLGSQAGGRFTVIEGNKRVAALRWRHCLDAIACSAVTAYVGLTAKPCPWLSPHA